jgi:hypothetical protein
MGTQPWLVSIQSGSLRVATAVSRIGRVPVSSKWYATAAAVVSVSRSTQRSARPSLNRRLIAAALSNSLAGNRAGAVLIRQCAAALIGEPGMRWSIVTTVSTPFARRRVRTRMAERIPAIFTDAGAAT